MGKTALVDFEVLRMEIERPKATLLKHCKPAIKDPDTGVLLYDINLARKALADVKQRVRKTGS
jgi:hypothetical protein